MAFAAPSPRTLSPDPEPGPRVGPAPSPAPHDPAGRRSRPSADSRPDRPPRQSRPTAPATLRRHCLRPGSGPPHRTASRFTGPGRRVSDRRRPRPVGGREGGGMAFAAPSPRTLSPDPEPGPRVGPAPSPAPHDPAGRRSRPSADSRPDRPPPAVEADRAGGSPTTLPSPRVRPAPPHRQPVHRSRAAGSDRRRPRPVGGRDGGGMAFAASSPRTSPRTLSPDPEPGPGVGPAPSPAPHCPAGRCSRPSADPRPDRPLPPAPTAGSPVPDSGFPNPAPRTYPGFVDRSESGIPAAPVLPSGAPVPDRRLRAAWRRAPAIPLPSKNAKGSPAPRFPGNFRLNSMARPRAGHGSSRAPMRERPQPVKSPRTRSQAFPKPLRNARAPGTGGARRGPLPRRRRDPRRNPPR